MLGTGVPEAKVVRDLFHLSIYSLSDTTAAERHAGVRKQDTGHNCKQQNYVAPWGWLVQYHGWGNHHHRCHRCQQSCLERRELHPASLRGILEKSTSTLTILFVP